MRDEGWSRFVAQAGGLGERHTRRTRSTLPLDAADRATIERVVAHGDVLVQPFVDEVPPDGELSLIFIDGEFSHAAIKRRGAASFRVQTEHGGTVAPIDVVPAIVAEARRSLDALDEMPLYARVDGVGDERSFRLMELELIEPNVFLGAGRRLGGSIRGGDRASARLVAAFVRARATKRAHPCPSFSPDATGRHMLLPPRRSGRIATHPRDRVICVRDPFVIRVFDHEALPSHDVGGRRALRVTATTPMPIWGHHPRGVSPHVETRLCALAVRCCRRSDDDARRLSRCVDTDAASDAEVSVAGPRSATAPVVNSLADDGDGTCTDTKCTLRDAIAFANPGATITFSVTGTIFLAQGELLIDKDLTIDGAGAAQLRVDGAAEFA